MSTAGITSVAASDALSPVERAKAAHLSGSALRNASPAEQRAAVGAQFEAILVRQMLGTTITSMLGQKNDAATSVYGDLMTNSFAQQLTAGSGLGIGRVIERQLTPRGAAAPAAAPAASGGSAAAAAATGTPVTTPKTNPVSASS